MSHCRTARRAPAALVACVVLLAPLAGGRAVAQEVLPRPEPRSKAEVGLSYRGSTPDFPRPIAPPAGAPNVLLVLLDDLGFGATSTFGGAIPTPTLDRLAGQGLRYNVFHTTAVCSPTRAAILSGRNHHSCNTGSIMEMATGYPGYHGMWPRSAASVAEILKGNGYNTAAFGKWHNTPNWETSLAGPFDRWPTGVGFEYWYGFQGGDSNQWDTLIFENTAPVEKPPGRAGAHFLELQTDRAIAWLNGQAAVAPDKPFFVYFAPGATHAPHHVPAEWVARFEGKFDAGWDVYRRETLARQVRLGVVPPGTELTPLPPDIPAWGTLPADRQRLYARQMEVYAAYVAYADFEVGRLIDAVERLGELDRTLVFYVVGDNGPSSEGGYDGTFNEMASLNGIPVDLATQLARVDQLGGPLANNHYPVGWCLATATPFRWNKTAASHFGGTRNPLVVSWPARIRDAGGLRSQFHHCVDIVPTILEAAGVPEPRIVNGVGQQPIEGVSMVYTFDDAAAPSRRTTQYFEIMGNRAIYHDGWVAASLRAVPWEAFAPPGEVEESPWELYHVSEDFSQAHDLAARLPEKLEELRKLFFVEAARYHVFPLDDRRVERFAAVDHPSYLAGRSELSYLPGVRRVPEGSAPDVKNRSFSVTAEVEVGEGGAEGVLVTEGGRFGGWALLVQDGVPRFVYNFLDLARYEVSAREKLPPGRSTVRFELATDGGTYGAGGTVTLSVNGTTVAEGRVDRTVPMRFSLEETFDVGEDTGTPVDESYAVPFRFTGTLRRVSFTLGPRVRLTPEAVAALKARLLAAEQGR